MVSGYRPWLALLVLSAALWACAAPQPAASATTAPAATAAAEPGRVRIDQAGLSLRLPEGWSVVGPSAAEAAGVSYTLFVLGTDPGSSGGPGTSQVILAEAAQLTAEAFVAAQCSTCPASPFVDMPLGGLPARRTQVGGGGVPFTVDWTFVERGGQLIGLSIRDPRTLVTLEDVLQSVQFDATPPSP